MKVGDLIKHFVDGTYGIITEVQHAHTDAYNANYPYLVHWLDGGYVWFDPNAIKPVNESR